MVSIKYWMIMVASTLLPSVAVTTAVAENGIQLDDTENRSLQSSSFVLNAFLCSKESKDGSSVYKTISNPTPYKIDEYVRVCLEPSTTTAQLGVSILKINTFTFYKANADSDGKTIQQKAIDSGSALSNTILDCLGGKDAICTFQTELRSQFYQNDGTVQGIGSVAVQYETENDTDDGARRRSLQQQQQQQQQANVVMVHLRGMSASAHLQQQQQQQHAQRQLQDFAGMVGVSFTFQVEDGYDHIINQARFGFRDHWNDISPGVQALYICGILVLLLLFCCFCAGVILWQKCCADIAGNWVRRRGSGIRVQVMPPTKQRQQEQDGEHSETYSIDDDELVQEGEFDDMEDTPTVVDGDDDDNTDTETPPSIKRLENGTRSSTQSQAAMVVYDKTAKR